MASAAVWRRATAHMGRLSRRCAFSAALNVEHAESMGTALCFTAEERRLRDVARSFAQGVLARHIDDMDRSGIMANEVLDGMFALGLLGVEIEEKFGGLGGSFTSSCLVVEEIAKVDPAVAVLCDIQNTLNNALIRKHGTPEQKAHYLPRLAKDMVSSFCLSESESGSDAFAMQSRAVKTDGGYILSGEKQWISNSGEAQLFVVMANADPSKGFRGITTFLMDGDTPGLHVGKRESKLGIRASSTCAVSFDNVKVPEDRVLGEVGQGYKYAIEMLNEGRIGIAAQMLGLAQGCLDWASAYFADRPLSEVNEAARTQIETEVEATRLLVYNATRLREADRPFIMEAAMAKLYASQVAERTARSCMQWAGAMGITSACRAEKLYRDSKIGAIYEGTSNIQLNTIAKLLDAAYR